MTGMAINPAAQPLSVPARPELTGGRRVGVLLSHGFTGSPASMRPWGEALAARGYGVEVPRLPGHGTTWREMNRTGWADWYGELERAFEDLASRHDTVAVCGLSMGGSLALRLAAEHADRISAVVLVNPAVNMDRKELVVLPVLKHVLPGLPGIGNDIKKPGVTEASYDVTPLKALHSMLVGWRALVPRLGDVTAPVLLFHSTDDHVVDPSSKGIIGAAVSGGYTERTLADSYHVATLDNDAETIFDESAEFIAEATAAR